MRKGFENLTKKIDERKKNYTKEKAEIIWNDMIEAMETAVDDLSDEQVSRLQALSIVYRIDDTGNVFRTRNTISSIEAREDVLLKKSTEKEELFIGNIFENSEVLATFSDWIAADENLDSDEEFFLLKTECEFKVTVEIR